jgi:hypothetical protein
MHEWNVSKNVSEALLCMINYGGDTCEKLDILFLAKLSLQLAIHKILACLHLFSSDDFGLTRYM